MQLYNKEIAVSEEGCMITYDSLSGYVDKSVSSKAFTRDLEASLAGLSLKPSPESIICEDLLTFINAQYLLTECRLTKPAYFQECYPKSLIQNCQKIGEGLYGEVFLFRNPLGGTTVMKIIPIEGDQRVNGECQKKLKEVFAELMIAQELSNLQYNRINQTTTFIEVQNIRCVQGRYPDELLELWQLHKETRGSINDSPEMFNDDQLYAILETNYGGCDLESFVFDDASQAFSMFLQVALAIAVAEEELEFEHRDLHWGNILLDRIPRHEKVCFTLRGTEIKIDSHGIRVKIIDFTMSRITAHGVDIYTDLAKDCGIFNGSGDYQFEIYQMMQKRNGNEWGHYEPYTNILWLSYILDKTVTALHYKNTCGKLHKKYTNKLKELNLEILGYDSAREFVLNLFGNKFL